MDLVRFAMTSNFRAKRLWFGQNVYHILFSRGIVQLTHGGRTSTLPNREFSTDPRASRIQGAPSYPGNRHHHTNHHSSSPQNRKRKTRHQANRDKTEDHSAKQLSGNLYQVPSISLQKSVNKLIQDRSI